MINLNNKKFKSVDTSNNGEVTTSTIFNYKQEGSQVWADYSGGSIVRGHLLAIMDIDGNLDMRYQHINIDNKLMTGLCKSRLEILSNGRIRFYEQWIWTSGDYSTGESIIEEI